VKFTTTRFGTLEIPDEEVLQFPVGVFGFPAVQRYVILDHNIESPLKWLQAIEVPDLAFPIIRATELVPQYTIAISADDRGALQLESGTELVTFVILTVPKDAPERTTANLRAPIVINPIAHTARQVLTAEDYPIRYHLTESQPATVECAG
jgi:flagellar assembly factor FliW